MNPRECRYSKEHEWVRLEPDGKAVVGITDYAQHQLGDIVFVYLPTPGTNAEQFKSFGEIESPKAVSELFSPVSGEVVEVNQKVLDSPEVVNHQPYASGWLIKVAIKDRSELDKLMTAEEYEEMIKGLE